jgi:hypothetical protein
MRQIATIILIFLFVVALATGVGLSQQDKYHLVQSALTIVDQGKVKTAEN